MLKYPAVFLSVFTVFAFQGLNGQDVFEAARKGDLARLEALYKLSRDTIQSKNESDFTPLIIAVYRNQPEAAEWLLKKGARVDAVSPEGSALVAAVYKSNFKLAELLLKNKANPDLVNADGVTALMYAAMSNDLKMAELLLRYGANKSLKSLAGKTAQDYANIYGFSQIETLLR